MSVDPPGVGESESLPGETGVEGVARALKAVADALRSGAYETDAGHSPSFMHVVGFGTSCGAMVTEVAQGLHAPYDAIIATAWANAGMHQDARQCLMAGSCTPDIWFHPPGTDPRIMDNEWNEYNNTEPDSSAGAPDAVGLSDLLVWYGCSPGPDELVCTANEGLGTPARDRALEAVAVPVLVVVAAEDRLVAPTTESEEMAHFGSDDKTFVVIPQTGHVMLLHVSLPETMYTADGWLDERGF